MTCPDCHDTGTYAGHSPECSGGPDCWRTCPVPVQCACVLRRNTRDRIIESMAAADLEPGDPF